MRLFLAAAFAALPFATSANAAKVYAACYYQDDVGKLPVTQLFTLEGDALRDYYGEFTYDKNRAWEEQFAQEADAVRPVSGFYEYNFVGQFSKFAEAQGDSHSNCWVTTSKDHALAWFAKRSREGRLDTGRIQDWRPVKAGVLAVEDWSGRPSANAAAEAEAEAPRTDAKQSKEAAADSATSRHKMTNAEADSKFAADKAEYEKTLAQQQKQVDDFKRAQDEVARKKQEQRLAAERAAADYQRQLEAHARTVSDQQLEYQNQLAKPASAPNAIYRGFSARTCDEARVSAVKGAGTTSGTQFKEVRTETGSGTCVVQGWWWDTSKGTATRQ
jgi:murein DD-endopeptidase MepM/ murein hydrolase activator NlpD